MDEPFTSSTILKDGWTLISAEERALSYPGTFSPSADNSAVFLVSRGRGEVAVRH